MSNSLNDELEKAEVRLDGVFNRTILWLNSHTISEEYVLVHKMESRRVFVNVLDGQGVLRLVQLDK